MALSDLSISPLAQAVIDKRYNAALSANITKRLGSWSKARFHEELNDELVKALGNQVIGHDDYQWMLDFIATDCLDRSVAVDMKEEIRSLCSFVSSNEEGYFDGIQIIDLVSGEHIPIALDTFEDK